MSELNLSQFGEMLLRLGAALLVGGGIGWERELDRKPAGLRTHMLVSLGSALFVMTIVQASATRPSSDALSRVIQGIVTGIGFLGAGEIFTSTQSTSGEVRIMGLTSAAAIWVTAALGVTVGCGFWGIGLAGAAATIFILRVVKVLERSIERRRQ